MPTHSQLRYMTYSRWPGRALSVVSLAALLLIIQDQRAALRAYYDTWLRNVPQHQILTGVNKKMIDPAKASQPQQDALALLPSSSNLQSSAQVNPSQTLPTPQLTAIIPQAKENDNPAVEEQPLMPDRIRIPIIQVDAAVIPIALEYTQVNGTWLPIWPVPPPDKAGWHNTSATLGQPGNTVINGHNYPQDAIFRSLYLLQPGDQIMLHARNRVFEYVVIETLILPEQGQTLAVRQANSRYILPFKDERLTLVTCHPYASLANRLLVIAVPINYMLDLIN